MKRDCVAINYLVAKLLKFNEVLYSVR